MKSNYKQKISSKNWQEKGLMAPRLEFRTKPQKEVVPVVKFPDSKNENFSKIVKNPKNPFSPIRKNEQISHRFPLTKPTDSIESIRMSINNNNSNNNDKIAVVNAKVTKTTDKSNKLYTYLMYNESFKSENLKRKAIFSSKTNNKKCSALSKEKVLKI